MKKSRMSGTLLECDGQYVGSGGDKYFRLLESSDLCSERPLVLDTLDPHKLFLELKSPPDKNVLPRDLKY